MKYRRTLMLVLLSVTLVGSAVLLAEACHRASQQYDLLFMPGRDLLSLAWWVFGAIGLLAVTSALHAALVRPFWVAGVGFAACSVAIGVVWGVLPLAIVLSLVYLLVAMLYARSVINGLDQRISFSIHPIREAQDLLVVGAVSLVSISMAAGYAVDSQRRGFLLPPAYKQTMAEVVLPALAAAVGDQGVNGLAPGREAARQGFERIWLETEAKLRPYARYAPAAFGLLVFLMLETLVRLVSWVPPTLLQLIFPFFKLLRLTRVATDTREITRLVLA